MAKISALPAASALTGDELLPLVQAGATRRSTINQFLASALAVFPAYLKGDRGNPGGNVLSVGSFAAMRAAGQQGVANSVLIPSGTTMVMTSHHTVPGHGRAFYERRDDLTEAHTGGFPRLTFKAHDENGTLTRWALVDDTGWNWEALGAIPDDATDCSPVFDEMEAYNRAFRVGFHSISGVPARTVLVPAGRYFFSRAMSAQARWMFVGAGGGMAGGTNSKFRWPANTHCVIVNRYNTEGDQVVNKGYIGAADGLTMTDIVLEQGAGDDRSKHVFWTRARATLRDVRIINGSGNGVHNVANSSTDGVLGYNTSAGNTNDSQFIRVSVQGRGGHAFFSNGIDANACLYLGCEVLEAGQGAFMENSFLGNWYKACASHGTNYNENGRCVWKGYIWDLISFDKAQAAQEPGTVAGWTRKGATTIPDNWRADGYYVPSGSVLCTDPNNRSRFELYIEGGFTIGRVRAPAQISGGQNDGGFTSDTNWDYATIGVGNYGFTSYMQGVGTLAFQPEELRPVFGSYIYNHLMGSTDPNEPGVIRKWGSDRTAGAEAMDGYGGLSMFFSNYRVRTPWRMRAPGDPERFGRSSSATQVTATGEMDAPFMEFRHGIVLGDAGTGRRLFDTRGKPPAGQDYGVGDVGKNVTPDDGNCLFFGCVTASVLGPDGKVVTEAVWRKYAMGGEIA